MGNTNDKVHTENLEDTKRPNAKESMNESKCAVKDSMI
jgi:hypothetical protein